MESHSLIIDCFAGGGGASTGIERALGRSVDYAINHDADALALHEANHPDTIHLQNDIWDVEPTDVAQGRHVGLLWASPDCKHFSRASGKALKDRNIRDLAWSVVKWAEDVKPDVILMENVNEFKTWGPICNEGRPIKEFAGVTYDLWIKRLKKAGYRVQRRELRGCDYGDPTIRIRSFWVMRCDGRPIVWPEPTHGHPDSKEVLSGKRKPWPVAADCIDWSLPCPSIFDTKEEIKSKHGLTAVRPLAPSTMARVARGMKRYVLEAKSPFIVNLTHGARVESADDPFRTITGANRGEKAVVAPSITRFNTGATGQDMRDPLSTVTANSWEKKPGGAAPLGVIAPVLTYAQHGGAVRDITDPHHTICANNKDVNGVIVPHLMTMRNAQKPFNGADQPTHTITAGGAGLTLVAPHLLSVAHGYSGGRREYPLTDPLGTQTSGGITHAVSQPYLMSLKGTDRRDSAATAPHPTVLAGGGHSAVIAPTLVQTGYGERSGQKPRSLDLHAPLGTIVACGAKHASVAAFLAQHHTGVTGHDVREPVSTVSTTGSHQNPVAAYLTKYFGTQQNPKLDEPAHTVTTKDRFGHVQAELAAPPFEPEHEARAREVAEFLRSHDAWDGGEFVTIEIDGQPFVIVDIGMRMLTPRELFRAQGFPEDYVIEGVWKETDGEWTWHPFTKSVQISCCGNSVNPSVAAALADANAGHLARSKRAQPHPHHA